MSFQADIFAPASKDLVIFYLDGANLQMQTYIEPKIIFPNFKAVVLWHYVVKYSKLRFLFGIISFSPN